MPLLKLIECYLYHSMSVQKTYLRKKETEREMGQKEKCGKREQTPVEYCFKCSFRKKRCHMNG